MSYFIVRLALAATLLAGTSFRVAADRSFRVDLRAGELVRASHVTDSGSVIAAITDPAKGTRLLWPHAPDRPAVAVPSFTVSRIVHVKEGDSRTRIVVQGAPLGRSRSGGKAQLLEITGGSYSTLWDSSMVDIPSGFEQEPHLSVSPDGTQWALATNVGDSRLIVMIGEFPSSRPSIKIVTDVDEKKSSAGGRAQADYPTVHLFSPIAGETVFAVHWRGRTNIYTAAAKAQPKLRAWLWTGGFADFAISVPLDKKIWASREGRWYEFGLDEALSKGGEIRPRRRVDYVSLGRGDFSRMTSSGHLVARVQQAQGRQTTVVDLQTVSPRVVRDFSAQSRIEVSPSGKYLLELPKHERSDTLIRYSVSP